MTPTSRDPTPKPMEARNMVEGRGVVLKILPPMFTMKMVATNSRVTIIRKGRLLKKFEKMLYSFKPNFLQLNWLNKFIIMKV
jgi:hypothetical protein